MRKGFQKMPIQGLRGVCDPPWRLSFLMIDKAFPLAIQKQKAEALKNSSSL
jgi:hypothetical protein